MTADADNQTLPAAAAGGILLLLLLLKDLQTGLKFVFFFKGIKARPQPIEGNKMCLLKNVYRRRRQVKKKERERERERDSKNISKRTVGGGGGNFVEAHSNAENSPERSTA